MKFMVGLLAGAALILAVSGDLRFGKVTATASSVWSALVQVTADSLFPTVEPVVPDMATPATEEARPTQPAASIKSQAPPEAAPVLTYALADADAGTDTKPAEHATVTSGEATEFVWRPFQSQMSADGFANQLGNSLNHPFEVHRQGPGRYQVGFNYESAEERALLLQGIAQITGTTR